MSLSSVLLVRVDPPQRIHRWYLVIIRPDLFGHWAVQCFWGSRLTSYQCQRLQLVEQEADAHRLAERIVRAKQKKGYRMAETTPLTYEQWQALMAALENAVALRESGEGGGHAALIQLLNQLGYYPLSSQDAERVAGRIIKQGYQEGPDPPKSGLASA